MEAKNKIRVIEEGKITLDDLKNIVRTSCSGNGMYGCPNENPTSFTVEPCVNQKLTCTDLFINCPDPQGPYTTCTSYVTCSTNTLYKL